MSTRRNSIHVIAGLVLLSLLLVMLVFAGCGEDSPVAEQTGNGNDDPIPPGSATVSVRVASWDDLTDRGHVEAIPGDVDEIRFEISASDITTQTRTIQAGQTTIEEDFTVLQGVARQIKVEAFNAADTLLYRGVKYSDVADSVLATAVGMVSVDDETPPAYTGLDGVELIADTYVLLSWQSATDGTDPDPEVLYLVYMSTESGNFDYSSPSYTSGRGETSLFIADLDPATTYYFVARAMDRAGNIDTNTSQQSVTTSSAGGALYVDVNTGVDNAGCGTSNAPCKTITYALSKTAGDQTIHVAKGTYNAASGETFPLQLKTGTALSGEGYWWMGVKVIKETFINGPAPVILGADNAQIISCYIRPTAWADPGITVYDAGYPINIYHCTIDGALFPGARGVGFGAASSLIDSRVENFSAQSVGVWGTGGALIKGNVVINNSSGITVGASNTTVSHNVVKNIASVGISVFAIDLTLHDVVIHHNYVTATVGNGMQITNVTNSEVSFNSISYAEGWGLAVNVQEPTHMLEIKNNSITHGATSAVWFTSGGANINGNIFVCNVTGIYLSTDQVIDLRWNEWDHNPPTISPGRGFYEDGCDGFFDICYQRDYASTPEPIYQPHNGKGTCQIGIVPSPPK